jgi:hypothetical protein
MSEAREWATKLLAHDKKEGLAPKETVMLRPMIGESGSVIFSAPHASMAELEEAIKKRHANSEWMKLIKKGTEADWYLETTSQVFEVFE